MVTPKRNQLSHRLLVGIMLFSAVMTLLATAFQLLMEYRRDLSGIDERLAQIEISNAQALSNSLWAFDQRQTEIQMQGIVALPDIESVEIVTSLGERYVAGRGPRGERTHTRSFLLTHLDDGRQVNLGTARVTASLADLYARLANRTLVILQSQAVKTFLISMFMLFLFRTWVTRHLVTMAAYARRLSFDNLSEPLVLNRRPRPPELWDELDEAVSSTNQMRESLQTQIAERETAEATNRFLAESSKEIAASLEYPSVVDLVCQAAVRRLGDLVVCYVTDDDGALRAASFAADPESRADLSDGDLGVLAQTLDLVFDGVRALTSNEPVFRSNLAPRELETLSPDPLYRALLEKLPCRAYAAVPLQTRHRRLGTLALVWVREGPQGLWSSNEREVAEEFARRASMALDNALLYREGQNAIRQRDEFLSMASHELKTPLTSLSLEVDRAQRVLTVTELAEGPLSSLQKSMRTIRRQVDRLSKLISELLDISQILAGARTLEREPMDLSALVTDVVDRMSEQLKMAGCDVVLRADERAAGWWDPSRLEQVVTNLIANAMKFGARKPIEITVAVQPETGLVRLTVKDQGIGIAVEQQSRIFDRFARAVSTRNFAGLGLGLFIAREIVEAHGGRIWVDSSPGAGAAFSVELLPALPAQLPKAPPDEDQRPALQP